MTFPDTIKIGSRTVTVRIAPLQEGLFGTFDPATMEIVMNKNQSRVEMLDTFWHEVIHAINDFNRLDAELAREIEMGGNGNADEAAFDLEERITAKFAEVFTMVIQDNNLLKLK